MFFFLTCRICVGGKWKCSLLLHFPSWFYDFSCRLQTKRLYGSLFCLLCFYFYFSLIFDLFFDFPLLPHWQLCVAVFRLKRLNENPVNSGACEFENKGKEERKKKMYHAEMFARKMLNCFLVVLKFNFIYIVRLNVEMKSAKFIGSGKKCSAVQCSSAKYKIVW